MSTEKIPERQLFSDRLKKARLERNMNGAEMADFIGVSAPVYSRYEKGRIPDAVTVAAIAAKCGKTVDWLMGRGVVYPNMAASDEARLMAENETSGKAVTSWYLNMVRVRMDMLRTIPPERHAATRADINQWLDKYQQWCVDNHPNEAALAAFKARVSAKDGKIQP